MLRLLPDVFQLDRIAVVTWSAAVDSHAALGPLTCQTVLSSPHLRRCDDICPTEVDLRDASDSDKRRG